MNVGEQKKTIDRKKWIIKKLRKGALPRQVIADVMEEYGLGEDMAEKLVYDCNKAIRRSLQDMYDNAAEYISNNVQAIAEDALDKDDRRSAIEAYKLLAKVLKVGDSDGKQEITINFGFSFSDEDGIKNDREQ